MALVLRSVFMDPVVDEFLRAEAYSQHKSKNDLIRSYLVLGIKAVNEGVYPMIQEAGGGAYAGANSAATAPLDALVSDRVDRNIAPDLWPPRRRDG